MFQRYSHRKTKRLYTLHKNTTFCFALDIGGKIRGVAQLVERCFWEAEVVSSNLATPTRYVLSSSCGLLTISSLQLRYYFCNS